MRKWILTALLVLLLAALAGTVSRWLPAFLAFVDVNSDRIQGITDLVQLVFWILAGLALLAGLWGVDLPGLPGRKEPPVTAAASPASPAVVNRHTETDGGAAIEGGANVTNGDLVGRDQITINGLVIADPDAFWRALRRQPAGAELRRATEQYLAHLVALYRYLDFRGMGMGDRVALRLPLLEMYVPLRARVERPAGETWARELRVAGRQMGAGEAEALGQRLSEPLPVVDLLRENAGLIVLGDPGAGKTTFLKYLALRLAMGEAASLGVAPRLPILVPLSAYAVALAEREIALDRFIAGYYENRGIGLPVAAMLDEALARGGALLLLDGLDEVKRLGQRRDVVNRVVDFFSVQSQRGNKFILTSRIVGYAAVKPTVDGLTECTLVDFDDDEITLFVERWSGAIEKAAQGSSAVAVQTAGRERDELLAALQRNPAIRHLAANPLLLTVLSLMKRQGVTLPERRVELYEQYIKILIHQWNLARSLGSSPDYLPDAARVVKVLAPLALWIHASSPGVGLVQEEAMGRKVQELFAQAAAPDPEEAARRFVVDVRDYANLLVERGHREYGFLHLTFEEYLAGVAIAQLGQQSIEPVVEALATHVGDPNWREVSLLAVGHLSISQGRDEAAGAVLEELLARRPGPPGEAVVLAGEALLDVWPGGVPERCKDGVLAALHRQMQDRAIPPALRLRAGILLADSFDRSTPAPDDLLRDLDTFLPIPASAALGNDFRIGDFRIGKYPVSNIQYRRFVEAGGYEESRWWTSGGWTQSKFSGFDGPPYWDDNRFNHSTQPVVGVSWYEAVAYCGWLTGELRRTGQIGENEVVRLPTEKEWMRAALPPEPPSNSPRSSAVLSLSKEGRAVGRADGKDLYPWGSAEFDPARANTKESGLEQTTPVQMYPEGATAEGVWDLAGNVWEWSADVDEKDGRPWLKGGAWYWDAERARASSRLGYGPNLRFNYFGFRVVVVPSSHG